MKKSLLLALVAALLAGIIGSTAYADGGCHKGRCYFQAKPSPTTLTYEGCPQPILPYQGPGPAPRFVAPLPDGCYRERRECEDNCRCKLFDKFKSCNRDNCNGCNRCK